MYVRGYLQGSENGREVTIVNKYDYVLIMWVKNVNGGHVILALFFKRCVLSSEHTQQDEMGKWDIHVVEVKRTVN